MNIAKFFKLPTSFTFLKRGAASLAKWPEEPLDLSVDQRGGFYPAVFGEKLNSRYTIVQKLGWGQHSSVWLAKDEQGLPAEPYVSIKILSAHATLMQNHVADELALLRLIQNSMAYSKHPGSSHILPLLANFDITGPVGRHLCLVQPVMGRLPALRNGRFPVPVVKSITKQLLSALSFLHNECRMVHTDLKLDNVLVGLDNLGLAHVQQVDAADSKASMRRAVSPESAPLSSPFHLFSLNEIDNMIKLSKFSIRLTDFGTAATIDGYHADIIQPSALRAPEVIVGCEWGTSADIWNLGCLVFELLTGRWLFVPRGGPSWTPEVYHLAHMPGITGEEYDISYFRKGKRYPEYFTDDGELLLTVEGVVGLEDALKSYDALTAEELPGCLSLLQSMLKLNPSDRANASDLSHHPWLSS